MTETISQPRRYNRRSFLGGTGAMTIDGDSKCVYSKPRHERNPFRYRYRLRPLLTALKGDERARAGSTRIDGKADRVIRQAAGQSARIQCRSAHARRFTERCGMTKHRARYGPHNPDETYIAHEFPERLVDPTCSPWGS